jgi:hypothetical protein
MSTSETIELIGYWNKNKEDPEIIFSVPKNNEEWDLVRIRLDKVKNSIKR